ncbi:MAG: protein TolR [Desulfobulbaceae bacterium]|nr:protein TolR [Desulfobulbaceae bacterium]MCK5404472.1 protein TolR [Desulfobulbaceae bacterium]
MAFSQGKNRRGLVADINVTPLVDVMLVLLIIFMITAPMMTQGVDVDLPETTSKSLPQKEEPILISINKKGEIYLNRIRADQTMLRQQLVALAKINRDRPIYLKADKQVPYGLVVSVMADIKEVGFDRLGMITRPPEKRR